MQTESSSLAPHIIISPQTYTQKQLLDVRDRKRKPALRHVVFSISLSISVALTRVVGPIAVTWIPGPSRIGGSLTADRVHLLEGQSEDVWTWHHGRFTCCGIW